MIQIQKFKKILLTQKNRKKLIFKMMTDDENDESQITSNWNSLINIWEQLLLQEEKAE